MEHLNLRHLIVSFTSILFCSVYFLNWIAQTVIKHVEKLKGSWVLQNRNHFNHYKHCMPIWISGTCIEPGSASEAV